MIFDADFSMGQGARLMAGFRQQAIVFWVSLFDTRVAHVRAKRVGIARDGQQHFIYQCRHGFGLVFGTACCVGELAHGIQAAFEGQAFEVNVVDQCCFLHDTADEVVGD